jgi:hypothetical protein
MVDSTANGREHLGSVCLGKAEWKVKAMPILLGKKGDD